MTARDAPLRPGDSFAGHRVLHLLGTGGMAEIHLARRDGGDPVVIKRLKPELADDPDARRMFMREAAVARLMHHRNVVRTIDLASVQGTHALIVEFLDGRSLTQLGRACYQRKRYLPYNALAMIIADVLSGLEHVHSLKDPRGNPLKLIHRDMSPDNVLITFGGVVKLVDFGIAKAGHAALEAGKTQTGVLRGKARYVAPEAMEGLPLDARADLFAVGVMLYELLSYARPFQGATDVEVLEALTHHVPVKPSRHNPKIPPPLDAICMQALEKDPASRWQSAGQMRDALNAWLKTQPRADLSGLLESMFPADQDADRINLRELLRDNVDEGTVELADPATATGMTVGLLAEALLDDDA